MRGKEYGFLPIHYIVRQTHESIHFNEIIICAPRCIPHRHLGAKYATELKTGVTKTHIILTTLTFKSYFQHQAY
jgi:hypothetical protein